MCILRCNHDTTGMYSRTPTMNIHVRLAFVPVVLLLIGQVSRFRAFIIGGGGIFESRHWPLYCEDFVDGLRHDLPVAIFGVGAR